MASRVSSRPRRTRVYDCNYHAGESYYKPMVDHLDRKYQPRTESSHMTALKDALNADIDLRPAAEFRRTLSPAPIEDEPLPSRRRPVSALMEDFDSLVEQRGQASKLVASALNDEEFDSTALQKIRARRQRLADMDEEMTSSATSRRNKDALDFQEQLMDSIGLKSSSIATVLDDQATFKKKALRMTMEAEDNADLTKWTALSPISKETALVVDTDSGAAARARKSRARLADLDAEMEEIADRQATRDRRAARLRQLIAENEENALQQTDNAVRVSKTITVRAEKKSVKF